MKEWAIKHPILTFLLAGEVVTGIVSIVSAITGKGVVHVDINAPETKDTQEETEEAPEEE